MGRLDGGGATEQRLSCAAPTRSCGHRAYARDTRCTWPAPLAFLVRSGPQNGPGGGITCRERALRLLAPQRVLDPAHRVLSLALSLIGSSFGLELGVAQ